MRTLSELSDMERRNFIVDVVKKWNTTTSKEVAQTWNVKVGVVLAVAARVRKAGIPLIRKTSGSMFTPDFVTELQGIYRK